jgi:hypothetical protein
VLLLWLQFAKTFTVVTLGGKQLLKVRLAVEYTTHGGITAKLQDTIAMSASEASFVKHLLISSQSFSWVHGLAAGLTLFCFVHVH